MPSDQFRGAVRSMLDGPIGTTATVRTFEIATDGQGDEVFDDHGDPRREVATEVTGVSALFRQPRSTQDLDYDSPAGSDETLDAIIFVPSDTTVHGAEEATFPSRIVREDTGDTFDALAVWDENNGEARVDARLV